MRQLSVTLCIAFVWLLIACSAPLSPTMPATGIAPSGTSATSAAALPLTAATPFVIPSELPGFFPPDAVCVGKSTDDPNLPLNCRKWLEYIFPPPTWTPPPQGQGGPPTWTPQPPWMTWTPPPQGQGGAPTPAPQGFSLGSPTPFPTATTIPPNTTLYAWSYEGEVRNGAIDATTIVLPDGTYRQFYQTWREYKQGQGGIGGYEVVATSKDGLKWTDEGNAGWQFTKGRPFRLTDGRYRVYYGNPRFGALTSVDGKTWQTEPPSNLQSPDPACNSCDYSSADVVILPDKSYRMFYNEEIKLPPPTSFGGGPPPANVLPLTIINSASSKDGLKWEKDPGVRINPLEGPEQDVNANHPRVVTLPDGTFKMFYWVATDTWSATSRDGLTWTNRQPANVFGGDPDILVTPDGQLRLFVNWRDEMLPGGPEVSPMWSYLWKPVSYLLYAPHWVSVPYNQAVTVPLYVTGVAGTKVTLTTTAFSGTLYDGGDPSSPLKIELAPSSGTVPFTSQVKISGSRSPTNGPSLVVLTGDDGNARVRQVIVPSFGPGGAPPPAGVGPPPAPGSGPAVPPPAVPPGGGGNATPTLTGK